MPNVPALPFQPIPRLFMVPLDSSLHEFLIECHRIVQFEPTILDHIESDFSAHGLRKKVLREADRRFLEGQTADLPKLRVELRELEPATMELESGRPRIDPYLVYLCSMFRGRFGGCKDQEARLLLEESVTMSWWLENLGLTLPAPSTLSENLNAVSEATHDFIHKAQLSYVLGEGLDDLQSLYLDSTAIKADSQRPSDSGLLSKLVERICRRGGKLDRFELPNMNPIGLEELQRDIGRMHRDIGFCTGKGKSKSRLKKLYYKLMRRARRACKRFERELATLQKALDVKSDLIPSQRLMAEDIIEMIGEDIQAIGQVGETCERRVMKGEKVPSTEKIISTSDADAAFIVKGGWNTVLGYRPQLGRSAQGFITTLIVPEGNAADSGQLIHVVIDHCDRTGVIPQLVSADDGYSDRKVREDLLELGVEIGSIGGAKGKKITPIQDWNHPDYRSARANRSAVESLMFTLKDGYDFGRIRRREIPNVRAELIEKALAYNLCQMIRVRKRRAATLVRLEAA